MIGSRTAAVLAVSIAMLALAGCSSATIPGTIVSSPPSLVTPPVASITVSPSGVGSLTVGEPVTAFDLVTYGEHTCPSHGGWIPRYPEAADTSGGQPLHPFDIVTSGGRSTTPITNEYVWSRAIATSKGIRVGSTIAAVEAAYPSAIRKTSYTTAIFIVDGTGGQLAIEVAGDNKDARGEWPTATLNTVVWMQVVPPGAKVVSIAGSDDAGPCPLKGHVPDLDGD